MVVVRRIDSGLLFFYLCILMSCVFYLFITFSSHFSLFIMYLGIPLHVFKFWRDDSIGFVTDLITKD